MLPTSNSIARWFASRLSDLLLHFWPHKPPFTRSLTPRPVAQPWDDSYGIPGAHGDILGALGIPSETCEFGVCGGAGPFVQGKDPQNPSQMKEFGLGSYICGDFVCIDGRHVGTISNEGQGIRDSSDLIFAGVGVGKDIAAVGIEAGDAAMTSALSEAFRPGSWLNQGRYWRIGWGKGPPKSGIWIFRIVINNHKFDLFKGGPRG